MPKALTCYFEIQSWTFVWPKVALMPRCCKPPASRTSSWADKAASVHVAAKLCCFQRQTSGLEVGVETTWVGLSQVCSIPDFPAKPRFGGLRCRLDKSLGSQINKEEGAEGWGLELGVQGLEGRVAQGDLWKWQLSPPIGWLISVGASCRKGIHFNSRSHLRSRLGYLGLQCNPHCTTHETW